jgi:hypothetical protein
VFVKQDYNVFSEYVRIQQYQPTCILDTFAIYTTSNFCLSSYMHKRFHSNITYVLMCTCVIYFLLRFHSCFYFFSLYFFHSYFCYFFVSFRTYLFTSFLSSFHPSLSLNFFPCFFYFSSHKYIKSGQTAAKFGHRNLISN